MFTIASLALAFAVALLFNGPSENLILLAFAVGLVLAAGARAMWQYGVVSGGVLVPRGPLPALAVLFLLWMLCSLIWSTWAESSFFYFWILGTLPLGILVWLYAANYDAAWSKLWRLLLLTTSLVAAWGGLEYLLTESRVHGPFIDPNAYGALMNLFFFPTLAAYVLHWESTGGKGWRLRSWELILFILSFALFATASRGAIGTWLLLAPVAFLALRTSHRQAMKALVTAGIVVSLAYSAVQFSPEESITRKAINLQPGGSDHVRLLIWQSAWEIYRDHPVTGTGLGTFKLHYNYYRSLGDKSTAGNLVHNDYLQSLQEGGPVQFGFLLALGFIVVRLLRQSYRKARASELGSPGAVGAYRAFGLLLGVIALFIHASVNFIFYVLPLSLVAGIFLAQAYRNIQPPEWRELKQRLSSPVLGLALVLAVLVPTAALALDGIAALVFLDQGNFKVVKEIRQDPARAYTLARRLALLRPDTMLPNMVMAETAHRYAARSALPEGRTHLSRDALSRYLKLIELRVANSFAYEGLAQLLIDFPDLAEELPVGYPREPETLLRLAISYSPAEPSSYLALAALYERTGRPQEAYSLLTQQALPYFVHPTGEQAGRTRILEIISRLARDLGRHVETDSLTRLAAGMKRQHFPQNSRAQVLTESLRAKPFSRSASDRGLSVRKDWKPGA